MTLLITENIWKSYGPVIALRGVSLKMDYNELVGLVGDNGAGKSTFIKILAGYLRPDKGVIYFNDKKVNFKSPMDAREVGVEVVYQDLALVSQLPVYRNIFLGFEKRRGILLDKKTMKNESKRMLKEFGIDIDVNKLASELSGGQRQMIAIVRALMFNANLLLLDEPTAALSVYEANQVLSFVKSIVSDKSRKVSAIIVSHNIHHVYSVATRIVIMDKGQIVLDVPAETTNPQEIESQIMELVRQYDKAIL
jgi:simple sugar transport system ATP-binding protein